MVTVSVILESDARLLNDKHEPVMNNDNDKRVMFGEVCGLYHFVNARFGWNRCSSFGNMLVSIFCEFCMKISICSFLGTVVLGDGHSIKVNEYYKRHIYGL